jgi:hypothetical protein
MDRSNEAGEDEIELHGSVTEALPPTDGGKDAYMVLAGCFLAEVFTWGNRFFLLQLSKHTTNLVVQRFRTPTACSKLITLVMIPSHHKHVV